MTTDKKKKRERGKGGKQKERMSKEKECERVCNFRRHFVKGLDRWAADRGSKQMSLIELTHENLIRRQLATRLTCS